MDSGIVHLPDCLRAYFSTHKLARGLQTRPLFITRRDGIVIYEANSKVETTTVGALLGGIWQAGHALMDHIPGKKVKEIFRLSFDTASRGVYILPFMAAGEEYFLGCLYSGTSNPALIKGQLRLLSYKLEKYLFEQPLSRKAVTIPDGSQDFLFDSLSDDEIDRIFNSISD